MVAIVLGLGFFVNWGLAALLVIIMIPGAISLAVLAKHPESTGGAQHGSASPIRIRCLTRFAARPSAAASKLLLPIGR